MKSYLPFLIPLVAFIVGCLLLKLGGQYDIIEFIGIMVMVFGGVLILISLVALPVNRAGTRTWMVEYDATKATLQDFRSQGTDTVSSLERATLINKVIEINRDLVSAQYWSEGVFEFYWPKEIRELKPLK